MSWKKKASVSEHITYPYVRPDDIRETAMLFPNETSFSGRFAKSYFQQHNLSPRIICCSPMTYPLYQMVASGCGVAILPSLPLKPMEFEEQIRYLSISEPTSNFTIGLIFRKDYSLSPQEKALAELIQAEFEKG